MEEHYLDIPALVKDSIARSIVSVIRNKGINLDYLNGIDLLSDLEQRLFGLVTNYGGTDEERQQIFHLIQIWGGRTGRNIYRPAGTPFDWSIIDIPYKMFIHEVSLITDYTYVDFQHAYNACFNFKRNIGNIGLGYSFITKHLRFWSFPQLGANLFPPYDSLAAGQYMQQHNYDPRDIVPYWQRIYQEASAEGLSVAVYERNLFNGFN